MGVKVATTGRCFQWSSSHPIIPHSQTLPPGKFRRARSFHHPHRPPRSHTIIRSASSPSSSFSFDEDFSRQISNLALAVEPSFMAPPEWHGRTGEETVIQRKANRVEIPVSLRIIKRKLKSEETLTDFGDGESPTSVKKAFSSMVFIMRELHIYSLLQMREAISSTRGDVESTLARVHRELHASFVWLFQNVFSNSPELMVSVMILTANFTVFSMDSHVASAVPPSPAAEVQINHTSRLRASLDRSNAWVVEGEGGREGTVRPAVSGMEGDGIGAVEYRVPAPVEEEDGSEARLWAEIVKEARRMEAVFLDPGIRFVSPVSVRIEPDDAEDYFRTEMGYLVGLGQDPNNPLLLANYAQFLYLVAQDYDRAEEYFKRAIKAIPKDPEAFNKYASFLWRARKDLWAAEETFLEAISVEPSNSFYAANYAHFLWNTGGEDTCFPLTSPDSTHEV